MQGGPKVSKESRCSILLVCINLFFVDFIKKALKVNRGKMLDWTTKAKDQFELNDITRKRRFSSGWLYFQTKLQDLGFERFCGDCSEIFAPIKYAIWCGITLEKVIESHLFIITMLGTLVLWQEISISLWLKMYYPHQFKINLACGFNKMGATPHATRATKKLHRQRFGEKMVSRGCSINWKPCSPDLIISDLNLCG